MTLTRPRLRLPLLRLRRPAAASLAVLTLAVGSLLGAPAGSQAAGRDAAPITRATDARAGTARHFIAKVSRNGRYFLDQHGHPVMMKGDTVWGLVFNAGRWGQDTTWRSDIDDYVAARAASGFNTIYVAALGNTINEGRYDSGATWDGVSPWVGGSTSSIGPHVGTLNDDYWQRVDHLLTTARAAGITVMLDIVYGDDIWENGRPGAMSDDGGLPSDGQMRTYGRMLGERYRGFRNVVWMIGGDYYGNADAKVAITLKALRAAGAKQLISVENWDKTSSYATGLGRRFAQWADVYSYAPTYRQCEAAWTQERRPVVWADGYYDQDSGADNDLLYRQEVGWALTSGSRGSVYGAEGLWGWSSESLRMARHPDAAARQMVTAWRAVSGLRHWYRLAPDIGSGRLLTGDRGTRITSDAPYTDPSNDYVTGSITPAGDLALVYLPRGGTAHVTWSHMAARHRSAAWLDPTTGRLRSVGAGRTAYTAPAGNATGQPDWYLVLRASS